MFQQELHFDASGSLSSGFGAVSADLMAAFGFGVVSAGLMAAFGFGADCAGLMLRGFLGTIHWLK